MSNSALCAIFKTKVSAVTEYRNGWGTGPMIWSHLRSKFLIGQPKRMWGEDDTALWELGRDKSVPLCLRACHVITFDRAFTPVCDMPAMSALVAEGGAILRAAYPGAVNHFPQIAKDMATLKLDPRSVGVGLCCTSVSDPWRGWRPSQGEPWDCYEYLTGTSTKGTT